LPLPSGFFFAFIRQPQKPFKPLNIALPLTDTLLNPRDAVTRSGRKLNTHVNVGAQCSPRHACPLKGPLLMQVQEQPQTAPELALAGEAGT